MKNSKLLSLVCVCVAAALFSCATTGKNPYEKLDPIVRQGEYSKAITEIQKDSAQKKPVIYPSPKNDVLYNLDKGVLEYYAQQYQDSFKNLEEAERIIQEERTKRISEELASLITNDNAKTYAGESYEDVYDSIFNALNNYHLGSLENARVEARQINEKLQQIILQADAEGKRIQSYGEEQMPGFSVPASIQSEPSTFNNSALGNYLSMVLFRGTPDASAPARQITEAYKASPSIYGDLSKLPKSLALDPSNNLPEELNAVPAGKGRLNVIGFAGLSPNKQDVTVDIPLIGLAYISALASVGLPPEVTVSLIDTFANMEMRLSIPAIGEARSKTVDRISVKVENGETFDLELLEDMGKVMTDTFNAQKSSIATKTLIRSSLKTITAATSFAAAEAKALKENNPLATAGVRAARTVLNEALKSTEAADTRMGRYFPNSAYVGGVNLDPGSYTLTITFYSGSQVVETKKQQVEVKAGGPNIAEATCLK